MHVSIHTTVHTMVVMLEYYNVMRHGECKNSFETQQFVTVEPPLSIIWVASRKLFKASDMDSRHGLQTWARFTIICKSY